MAIRGRLWETPGGSKRCWGDWRLQEALGPGDSRRLLQARLPTCTRDSLRKPSRLLDAPVRPLKVLRKVLRKFSDSVESPSGLLRYSVEIVFITNSSRLLGGSPVLIYSVFKVSLVTFQGSMEAPNSGGSCKLLSLNCLRFQWFWRCNIGISKFWLISLLNTMYLVSF